MFKKQIENRSLNNGKGLYASNGAADFHRLVILLYNSIIHHDYNCTERVMEAVCKWSFQGGELPLKIIKEISLCHTYRDGFVHDVMKVIKQALVLSHKYRIENLLNIVFFLLLHNDFEEAYQTLLRSVNCDPFNSSPLCHGYVGMLAYYLLEKETIDDLSSKDDLSFKFDLNCVISEAKGSNSQLCIHHFTQILHVLSLHSTSPKGQYDIFLTLQVQSLERMGKTKQEIVELLSKYLKLFPSSINAHRLMLRHCDESEQSSDAFVCVRESLFNVDPSGIEVLPLIEDMLARGDKSAVKHLMIFLDYPHNHGCKRAWSLLKDLPKTLEVERKLLWTSRRWWNKLHQLSSSTMK